MTTQEFNQNLSKIESLLFGFAMKLTRNKDNAKDLMQETLMRCYDNRERFQQGTNFKSWSTTVMYNAYINHYRKGNTRKKVIKPVEDFNLIAETNSAKGKAHSILMLKELHRILAELQKEYRIPFKMYVEGYQYDEIAENLNLPLGTVKSRIFYARKRLKKMVTKRYGTLEILRAS